jgi:LuxR family transcriptional regulator
MRCWAEDLFAVVNSAGSDIDIFHSIEAAAYNLGFEYCAYGLRVPLPASNPKIHMLNNYPAEWQRHYQEAGYLNIDPTVLHGRRTQSPLIWNESVFAQTPELWAEAQSAGLRIGWVQSSRTPSGIGSMLTLARSSGALSDAELKENECKMRLLLCIAHTALTPVLVPKLNVRPRTSLTEREIDVLKWSADGKTSIEISDILAISVDTVNFHIKNAITKLGAANKTGAVVRAITFGLLD